MMKVGTYIIGESTQSGESEEKSKQGKRSIMNRITWRTRPGEEINDNKDDDNDVNEAYNEAVLFEH